MRRFGPSLVVCASLLALGACAARRTPGSDVVAEQGPGLDRQNVVTLRARVEAIDRDARTVTMRTSDGDRSTFRVDESVPNFERMEKGDDIVVRYLQSVAFRVRRRDEATAGVRATKENTRARPDEKPGMTEIRTQTITARVLGVDAEARQVMLEGPQGETLRVRVDDRGELADVQRDDLLEVTYREAIAVSVEQP